MVDLIALARLDIDTTIDANPPDNASSHICCNLTHFCVKQHNHAKSIKIIKNKYLMWAFLLKMHSVEH